MHPYWLQVYNVKKSLHAFSDSREKLMQRPRQVYWVMKNTCKNNIYNQINNRRNGIK
uniref:Uncharacterized protein n=1 Tax=Siphoviridae sp. ctkcl3 TaxID=2826445 RepID=A0A8S5LZ43_9CAUD|nr:MAG TPA: hypothetical protein [Siphoviridae sp. ctkcl3]